MDTAVFERREALTAAHPPLYDNLEDYPPFLPPSHALLGNYENVFHSQPATPARYRRCASDPSVKIHSVRPAASETRLSPRPLTSDPKRPQSSFVRVSAKLRRVFSRPKDMAANNSETVARRNSNPVVPPSEEQRLSFASTSTGYSSARSSVRSSAKDEYEDMLSAVLRPLLKDDDALSSPKKVALLNSGQTTYLDRLAMELLDTERAYVNDLNAIIQGYLNFLLDRRDELGITAVDICQLFGNIEQVFDFNRHFYLCLDACRLDLLDMAQTFLDQKHGFSVYAHYCTQYPKMVATLSKLCQNDCVRVALNERQMGLGHSLPIGPYLLKPIQRVLKYHLFLDNILRNWDHSKRAEVSLIEKALSCMTSCAENINEVKKREEHAARVQEIQRVLMSWKTDQCQDLTQYGDLMLESSFRLTGSKTVRQLFLFEEMLLITKEKSDGTLQCKDFIMCSNLMLVESVATDPLAFQVLSFENPRIQYTLQSRSLEEKRQWTHEIKRLMLEHYNAEIPSRAKQIVMQLATPKVDKRAPTGVRAKSTGKRGNPIPKYLEKRRKSVDASVELKLLGKTTTARSVSTTDLAMNSCTSTPCTTLPPKKKTRSYGRMEEFLSSRRESSENREHCINRLNVLRLRKAKNNRPSSSGDQLPRRYFQSNDLQLERLESDKRSSATSSSGTDSAYESGAQNDRLQEYMLENWSKIPEPKPEDPDVAEVEKSWQDIENTFADLWQEIKLFSGDNKESSSLNSKFPLTPPLTPLESTTDSKQSTDSKPSSPSKAPIELTTPVRRIRPQRPSLNAKTKSLGNLAAAANKAKYTLDQDLHTDDEDSSGSLYDTLFEWELERKLDALRWEAGPDDDWPDLMPSTNERVRKEELEPLRHLVSIRESVLNWEANVSGRKERREKNGEDGMGGNLGVVQAMVKQWEVSDQCCHL